jgi:hypothetical protein
MRVPEKVRHWLKIEWPGEVVHRVGMGGVQEKVPETENEAAPNQRVWSKI